VIYVAQKRAATEFTAHLCLPPPEFNGRVQTETPQRAGRRPFMEKLLLEACLEAMQTGAVVAIQDMGARRPHLLDNGNGFTRRHRHRDRPRQSSPARDRHDAYEIMLTSRRSYAPGRRKRREQKSWPSFKKVGLDAVVVGHVTEGGIARINNDGRVAAEKFPRIRSPKKARISSPHRRTCATRRNGERLVRVCSAKARISLRNFLKLLASPAIAIQALDHRAV